MSGMQFGYHPNAYLAQVKDLNPVVCGLAPDDNVVLVPPELSPDTRLCLRGLGQTAEVDELSITVDFGKRSTVCLSNGHKLAAARACPAPGRRALAGLAAQVGMADKVVEIHVVAAERVERVAGNDLRCAVGAGDDVFGAGSAPPLPRVERPALPLAVP